VSVHVFYINDDLVPGTECTYTIVGQGETVDWDRNDYEGNTDTGTGPFTWIDVVMEPTG
jgi:hypothetical protein